MKVLVYEQCPKCKMTINGIIDAYFIYKNEECIECNEKHNLNARKEYKEIFYDYQDGLLDEEFYQVINISLKDV